MTYPRRNMLRVALLTLIVVTSAAAFAYRGGGTSRVSRSIDVTSRRTLHSQNWQQEALLAHAPARLYVTSDFRTWHVNGASLTLGKALPRTILPYAQRIFQKNSRGRWTAYSLSPTEWLVLYVRDGTLETVQIAHKARTPLYGSGPESIWLGESPGDIASSFGQLRLQRNWGRREVSLANQSASVKVFFGLDRANRVDRYGASRGDSELPPYIRWFQNSGREAVRPFPIRAASVAAENLEEQRHLNVIGCVGRETRHVIRRDRRGALDSVETRCGHGAFEEPFYFKIVAASGAMPRISDAADGADSAVFSGNPATPVPLYRPGGRLAPVRVWELRSPKHIEPSPRATPRDAALLHARGRQTSPSGIARRTLTVSPLTATPPPVLMTGYADSPNGRRFGPAYEDLVSEFSYNSNLNPTSFQVWMIGPGDPNLGSQCHPYYVADPFVNQYQTTPLPTPMPLPTPQPFATIVPAGTFAPRTLTALSSRSGSRLARSSIRSTGIPYAYLDPQKQLASMQGHSMVTRQVGNYAISYYPQEFSSGDPTASHYVLSSDCPYGTPSSNKCDPDSLNELKSTATPWCPQGTITCVLPETVQVVVAMYVGTTIYLSNPIEYQTADDPRNFEHSGVSASSSVGQVDPVSGTFFERHTDIKLAGPMGIDFSRWYDSRNSTFSHSNMGNGWRHSYSNYLDLSAKCSARVAYVDAEGNKEYFSGLEPGNYAYDQLTGNTLFWNGNDSYTLTTWDSQQKTFNNAGQMTSESDRYGNTQTLTYTGSGGYGVSTVTDALGRVLTFNYNSSYQLTSATVSGGGPAASFTYGCNSSLCSATEPDGGVWNYSYSTFDYGSYLTKITDPNGKVAVQTTYQTTNLPYSQSGSTNWPSYRVATQQGGGANQNSYTFTYQFNQNGDADDGLDNTVVTDSLGRSTYFTWSMGLQQITDVVGPLCNCGGGERHYTYDNFGRMTSVNDGASQTYDYSYRQDVISQGTYGGTYETPVAYTQLAIPNMTQLSDLGYAYGRTKTTVFGPAASVTQDLPKSITEPSAIGGGSVKTTTFKYSMLGQPTTIAVTGYTSGAKVTYTSNATYDSRGRILTTKGPRTDVNETTTYSYYSDSDSDLKRRGQLDTIKDALGHVTTYGASGSYDWFGNPLSTTDPNGVVVQATYDALGRQLTNTVDAIGAFGASKTTLTYDKMGQPATVTLPNGNGSTYVRDATERLTSRIVYDAANQQHEQILFGFDAMSEPTTISRQGCSTPAASCTSWYTGQTNQYAFDTHARLSQITYGPTATATDETLFNYNDPPSGAPGQLASVISGNISDINAGNSNVLGHLYYYSNTRLPSADYYVNGGSPSSGFSYNWDESYNYDVLNHLSSIVPYNGPQTNFTYDDWGRRTNISSSVYGNLADSFDPSNNLVTDVDANGDTTTYTYDALERPLTQTSSKAGVPTETVTWTYDDPTQADLGVGRLWKATDPSGSQSYTYEPRGLVASHSQSISGKATYGLSYTYDGDGNVKTMTYPSGRIVSYGYDYLDRPISAKTSTTTYVSNALYAPFGPRTSTSYGNGMVESLVLDKNYQVSELVVTGASGSRLVDRGFLRDGQHRITSITDNLAAGYNLAYAFSAFQLSSANSGASLWGTDSITDDSYWYNVQSQQYSSYHGTSYNYGLTAGSNPWQPVQAGINGSNTNILYDADGNVTGFSGASYSYSPRDLLASGEGLSYTYNGDRQRVLTTGSSGSRASIYNSDDFLIAESQLATATTGYEYIYLDGQPVAQEDIGGSTHWTAQDHIGTPFLQTTSSDTPYWFADYEPFGAVYALRTADAHQPLRRPGQEATLLTGTSGPQGDSQLFYNGARWALPHFGRYTQPDPSGLENSIENPYAYTFVDPVNQNDEDGKRVFIATHAVWQDGWVSGHAYILLIPDHIYDFDKDKRFHLDGSCSSAYRQLETTISGEPQFHGKSKAGKGGTMLDSIPGDDDVSPRDNLQLIPTPKGLSDTQFIRDLLNTDSFYQVNQNGVNPYDFAAGIAGNGYNSNGYAHSILNANGVFFNAPALSGGDFAKMLMRTNTAYLPGWDKTLDLPRGSAVSANYNCPLSKQGPRLENTFPAPAPFTLTVGGGNDGTTGDSGVAGGSF